MHIRTYVSGDLHEEYENVKSITFSKLPNENIKVEFLVGETKITHYIEDDCSPSCDNDPFSGISWDLDINL